MTSVEASAAYARLKHAYENPLEAALAKHGAGVPVAGYTSNTVPWELLRAAGFFPVLLQAHAAQTPRADVYMEPTLSRRARSLFDGLLSCAWSFLKVLIIPRTSEQEHKLYLYLTEVIRLGNGAGIPGPYLFNLLQTRSARSRTYGAAETKKLLAYLAGVSGIKVREEAIVEASRESNDARRAIRSLLKLRRGKSPRLGGAEAMRAIGAWYFMDRGEYASAVRNFVAEVSRRAPLRGPHILIKGVPLDHSGLHEVIESEGAVVTAEDDWWGSRAAGKDIRIGGDPVVAVFEKYYVDAPSPRMFPPSAADRWFQAAALRDIEGVVFYLPSDDEVLGWDYPRERRWLDEHNIPSLLVREDARQLSGQSRECIAEFVGRVARGTS